MNKSESKYFNTAAKMNLAFISLLKEKPFDYITVSEICKRAGVNRSTFYLHYETISDLLDETVRYMLNSFLSYFANDEKSVSLDPVNSENEELVFIQEKYLKPYLEYVRENKEVFATALVHNKTFNFENIHKLMFENIYNPILDKFGYPENYRNYIMRYYLNGILAVVLEWMKNDCDKSTEEIIDIVTICIFGLKKN